MGRPSIFTAELAAAICERISLGESLRKICREQGMPDQATVHRWLSQDDAFASKYARAREYQGDTMFDRVIDTVEKVESGEIEPDRARVSLAALQWTAAKLRPKKYGERQTVEHEGGVNLNVVQVPLPAGGIDEWLKLTSSGNPAADPSTSS